MRWTCKTFKLFNFSRRKHILSASIVSVFNFNDPLHQHEFNQFKKEYGFYIEDNWERVKRIFKKDEYGDRHYEMKNAFLATKCGIFSGCGLGAVIYYRGYYHNFLACGDSKIFLDVKDAQKSLLKHSLKGAAIGAIKIGPLLGLFLGTFSLFSSIIQVYRNKTGILDYAAGGFCTGAVFRFFYGIRGMLVGGIVGFILGMAYGMCIFCMSKIYGLDGMELKYIQYVTLYKGEKEKSVIDTVKAE